LLTGTLFDIKSFSIHDGPGIRTTVFFKGCPLHCAWCHNPEGISSEPEVVWHESRCMVCLDCVDDCPNQALTYQQGRILADMSRCEECLHCADICPTTALETIGWETTVEDLLQVVMKDRPFFEESGGGITCSGGEPLLQTDFLFAFLEALKINSIHTTLDTCGLIPEEQLQKILPVTDLILYDLKVMDPDAHQKATGVDNALILQNLKWLSDHAANVRIRLPLIPGFNDSEENLSNMIVFLQQETVFRKVDILPYHPTAEAKYERLNQEYLLKNSTVIDNGALEKIRRKFINAGFTVQIGG
jgi:pyruvate formate lyase activating enzyme